MGRPGVETGLLAQCRAELASELFIHHVVAEVGDVTDHAGNAQAALRNHAMVIEMPPMKVGVGDDGAACHFIEGDVLGRQVRGARNDHGVAHALRVLQRPAKRLHAA